MNKDLNYLAHHVTDWPAPARYVRLDRDGEICFDTHCDDFFPEGRHTRHPCFIPDEGTTKVGRDYPRAEWEAARQSLFTGVDWAQRPEQQAAKAWLNDMLDTMSRSDALPDRDMVDEYVAEYARQCVMDLRKAITDEGGLYLFRADDGYPTVTTADKLRNLYQTATNEEAVLLSGAERL